MNKLSNFLLASTALTGLAATSSLAASSGNFSATVDNTQCTIDDSNGTLTPAGATVFPISFNTIKVQIANGAGTTLVVTPSLVTGLFTDNQLSKQNLTSIQDVGIQIQVNVTHADTGTGTIHIQPQTTGDPNADCDVPSAPGAGSCVIYDQRFIEISSTALASLAACSTSTTTCFELIESTLSAHAFNFYVQAPGGAYNFDVSANLFEGSHNAGGSVAGCAGPGTVTVVQTKNFSFDTQITF